MFVHFIARDVHMNEATVTITVSLDLPEGEARLLLDHANATNQSIPDTIRSLLAEALTSPLPPPDIAFSPLDLDPSHGMPEALSDANHPS
jgi:hypothetical protein